MKQRLTLGVVLLTMGAALVVAQRRHVDAPANGQAIVYFVADSEHELTRLPARFTRISDADEIGIGNRIAETYRVQEQIVGDEKNRAIADPLIEKYVKQIGARVSPYAQRKLPYQFHYIPDRDFINAFALPGGHVFIGAGLIERMETGDELASVLGHEVEHIDHYHCAERLQAEAALRKVPLGELLAIPSEFFQAGYSKDQELEADREGVRLAARSGYSAYGAVRMFETFDMLFHTVAERPTTPQQELSKVATDVLNGYFMSHPSPEKRISQIKSLIASEPGLVPANEKDMEIGYIFYVWHSFDEISREKFEKAAELASRSLKDRPDYLPALQALAEAQFGGDNADAGKKTYRALLTKDTTAAGAVESWVSRRAQHFVEQRKYDRAITLAGALLELQPGEPGLLRLLATAQAGGGDIEGATATAEKLRRLYPDIAAGAAGELAQRASNLLNTRDFPQASAFARLSGALQPGSALRTLGEAEFAQAHFVEAAGAYRQSLGDDLDDVNLLRAYADALGSTRRTSAAQEFQNSLSNVRRQRLPDSATKPEWAGLALLAGNEAPSRDLLQQAERGAIAPEALGRLVWWYFRARRVPDALVVVRRSLMLRPGDAELQSNLAWLQLEAGQDPQRQLGGNAIQYPGVHNAPAIATAIARWDQKKNDEVLRDWPNVSRENPEWLNASWRSTIYPQHIADSVEQIEAEYQRRETAKRAKLHIR